MKYTVIVLFYLVCGVVCGKIYGFSGIIDIILFPITVPLKIWHENNKKE